MARRRALKIASFRNVSSALPDTAREPWWPVLIDLVFQGGGSMHYGRLKEELASSLRCRPDVAILELQSSEFDHYGKSRMIRNQDVLLEWLEAIRSSDLLAGVPKILWTSQDPRVRFEPRDFLEIWHGRYNFEKKRDRLIRLSRGLLGEYDSVFFSYSSKDKKSALEIAERLQREGVEVWLDHAEIKIGGSLIEKIREGIDSMDYLAVLLSGNSVQSEWVKREVDIAMNQEIDGRRIRVLPLLLEDCDLPGFLKGKLYADFSHRSNFEISIGQILRRLRKHNDEMQGTP